MDIKEALEETYGEDRTEEYNRLLHFFASHPEIGTSGYLTHLIVHEKHRLRRTSTLPQFLWPAPHGALDKSSHLVLSKPKRSTTQDSLQEKILCLKDFNKASFLDKLDSEEVESIKYDEGLMGDISDSLLMTTDLLTIDESPSLQMALREKTWNEWLRIDELYTNHHVGHNLDDTNFNRIKMSKKHKRIKMDTPLAKLIATRSQKRLSDLITGIFHMRERQAEFIRLGTTCQSNPSGPVSEITEGENLYSKIEMNLETDHGDSKLTDGKTRFRKRAIEVAHQSTNLHYGWHQILTLAPFLSTFPPETIERVRHKMSLIFPQ